MLLKNDNIYILAVIPAKAGIQKEKNWIPCQARNDKRLQSNPQKDSESELSLYSFHLHFFLTEKIHKMARMFTAALNKNAPWFDMMSLINPDDWSRIIIPID